MAQPLPHLEKIGITPIIKQIQSRIVSRPHFQSNISEILVTTVELLYRYSCSWRCARMYHTYVIFSHNVRRVRVRYFAVRWPHIIWRK